MLIHALNCNSNSRQAFLVVICFDLKAAIPSKPMLDTFSRHMEVGQRYLIDKYIIYLQWCRTRGAQGGSAPLDIFSAVLGGLNLPVFLKCIAKMARRGTEIASYKKDSDLIFTVHFCLCTLSTQRKYQQFMHQQQQHGLTLFLPWPST